MHTMLRFSRPLSLGTALLLAALNTGCSIHGTYPDSTQADAANLRFSSSLGSATMDLFDAQHCMGQTTGILNNTFAANTDRRVGMPPPAQSNTAPYLEVRLKPQQPLYISLSSRGSLTMCGTAFSFTPQKGAQYELSFEADGAMCAATMKQLHSIEGAVSRTDIPIVNTGWPTECNGANPIFKGPRPAQPGAAVGRTIADPTVNQVIDAQLKNPALLHP